MEDLQAIRRLKRGDIGGLECLIARYQEKALRTAFLITNDEPMAEDIVQDVFVRFYERAKCFDESRPVVTSSWKMSTRWDCINILSML